MIKRSPLRKRILGLAVASALAGMGNAAFAGSAALTWNASATTGQNAATGYNVYFGTTKGGPYPTKQAAGLNLSATVPGLTNGVEYCFVVTAFNTAGESGFSNEACKLIPFPPANSAPSAPVPAPSVTATP